MNNPYETLPSSSFWRTAVSERSPLNFENIYRKKFDLAAGDMIATAGSCFAQHIGRSLVKNGYRFRDFEPPPTVLPRESWTKFGYGVYSARYGNIYTARQLLQTFRRAFRSFEPNDHVVETGGRWFDLLRPAIEINGFASKQECLNSLQTHLASVRKLFRKTDVFVFTLGLTEAWVNVEDGLVYPVCPGTVAGEFDADKHKFHNFGFSEIIADMNAFFSELRAVNPDVRVLVTVSPVPLTATAADQHVLVASMYSKSVLRAVAGELSQTLDYVDYYPSYELVASHPMRAMYFDPNLRTVTAEGVELVLSHFFKQHPPVVKEAPRVDLPVEAESQDEQVTWRERRERRKSRKAARTVDEDDVVCEEMMLDRAS